MISVGSMIFSAATSAKPHLPLMAKYEYGTHQRDYYANYSVIWRSLHVGQQKGWILTMISAGPQHG